MAGNVTLVDMTVDPPVAHGVSGRPVFTTSGGSGATSDQVQGAGANGAAVTGNPVLVAGSDGTNARTLLVSTAGALRDATIAGGSNGNGAAANPAPVVVGGYDGANIRSLSTDNSGKLNITGAIPSGNTDTGNPIKIGGFASSTAPTAVTTGQRVNAWYGLNGQTVIAGVLTAGSDAYTNNMNMLSTSSDGTGRITGVGGFAFNGTTWDRERKPNTFSRLASSAAAGSPTIAKASAGDVTQFFGLNTQAALRYLHIYNKATAPALGTDTPLLSYPIPASSAFSLSIPNGGAYFSTGISYAFTTDIVTVPATGAAAGDITAFTMLVA